MEFGGGIGISIKLENWWILAGDRKSFRGVVEKDSEEKCQDFGIVSEGLGIGEGLEST